MMIPDDLAGLLAGRPALGAAEQAFPFVTVDDSGFAHPSLLSRAELTVVDDAFVVAVVAGPTTILNLLGRRVATLIAVGGTTAHYTKLRVVASAAEDRFHGFLFEVVTHRRDSLGIELAPLGFVATETIARAERWDLTARLADRLAAGAHVPPGGTVD